MTTPIGELISPENVSLDVDVRTRDELLLAAAERLAPRAGVAAREVYEQLRSRERLGSTALGHGIALPHARMPITRPVAAFLRTHAGIEFVAPDGRPVRYFLALLVPAEAIERHLALTACAARQFADPGFRARLRAASLPSEIVDLFAELPA
jgi:PTS system nitrogen regulatory IIA component